jgi:hypothetical protein
MLICSTHTLADDSPQKLNDLPKPIRNYLAASAAEAYLEEYANQQLLSELIEVGEQIEAADQIDPAFAVQSLLQVQHKALGKFVDPYEMPVYYADGKFYVFTCRKSQLHGAFYHRVTISHEEGNPLVYTSWKLHDVKEGVKHESYTLREHAKEHLRGHITGNILRNFKNNPNLKQRNAFLKTDEDLQWLMAISEYDVLNASGRIQVLINGNDFSAITYHMPGAIDPFFLKIRYLGGEPESNENWKLIEDELGPGISLKVDRDGDDKGDE